MSDELASLQRNRVALVQRYETLLQQRDSTSTSDTDRATFAQAEQTFRASLAQLDSKIAELSSQQAPQQQQQQQQAPGSPREPDVSTAGFGPPSVPMHGARTVRIDGGDDVAVMSPGQREARSFLQSMGQSRTVQSPLRASALNTTSVHTTAHSNLMPPLSPAEQEVDQLAADARLERVAHDRICERLLEIKNMHERAARRAEQRAMELTSQTSALLVQQLGARTTTGSESSLHSLKKRAARTLDEHNQEFRKLQERVTYLEVEKATQEQRRRQSLLIDRLEKQHSLELAAERQKHVALVAEAESEVTQWRQRWQDREQQFRTTLQQQQQSHASVLKDLRQSVADAEARGDSRENACRKLMDAERVSLQRQYAAEKDAALRQAELAAERQLNEVVKAREAEADRLRENIANLKTAQQGLRDQADDADALRKREAERYEARLDAQEQARAALRGELESAKDQLNAAQRQRTLDEAEVSAKLAAADHRVDELRAEITVWQEKEKRWQEEAQALSEAYELNTDSRLAQLRTELTQMQSIAEKKLQHEHQVAVDQRKEEWGKKEAAFQECISQWEERANEWDAQVDSFNREKSELEQQVSGLQQDLEVSKENEQRQQARYDALDTSWRDRQQSWMLEKKRMDVLLNDRDQAQSALMAELTQSKASGEEWKSRALQAENNLQEKTEQFDKEMRARQTVHEREVSQARRLYSSLLASKKALEEANRSQSSKQGDLLIEMGQKFDEQMRQQQREHQARAEQLTQEVAKQSETITQLNATLSDVQRAQLSAETELDNTRTQWAEADRTWKEEKERMQTRQVQYETSVEERVAKLQVMHDALERSKSEAQQAHQAEKGTLLSTVNKLQDLLTTEVSSRKQIMRELAEKEDQVISLTTKVSELVSELKSTQARYKQDEAQDSAQDRDRDVRLQRALADNERMTRKATRAIAKYREAKAQNESLKRKLSTIREAREMFETEITSLSRRLQEQQSTLEHVQSSRLQEATHFQQLLSELAGKVDLQSAVVKVATSSSIQSQRQQLPAHFSVQGANANVLRPTVSRAGQFAKAVTGNATVQQHISNSLDVEVAENRPVSPFVERVLGK